MYNSVQLDAYFQGENDASDDERWCFPGLVQYLEPDERKVYILTARDGLLYDASGALFDTTASVTAHNTAGFAVFVMAEDGTIYASNYHERYVFHHSSFLGGGPVASAGEIRVKEGRVEALTNKSGHYKPPIAVAEQLLQELGKRGVDTHQLEFTRTGH